MGTRTQAQVGGPSFHLSALFRFISHNFYCRETQAAQGAFISPGSVTFLVFHLHNLFALEERLLALELKEPAAGRLS